jgi:hypothetical protein
MKAYICDSCGVQVPPTLYDSTPSGWYTLIGVPALRHACSPACLRQIATRDEKVTPIRAPEVAHA